MAIRIPKNYLIAAAPLLSKNKSGRSAKFNESEFFWGGSFGGLGLEWSLVWGWGWWWCISGKFTREYTSCLGQNSCVWSLEHLKLTISNSSLISHSEIVALETKLRMLAGGGGATCLFPNYFFDAVGVFSRTTTVLVVEPKDQGLDPSSVRPKNSVGILKYL